MRLKNKWLKFLYGRFLKSKINLLSYTAESYVQLQSSVVNLFNFISYNHHNLSRSSHIYLLNQNKINSKDIKRCGSQFDGGYITFQPDKIFGVISVGVGYDISWDVELESFGAKVFLFDHTVRGLPVEFTRAQFYKIGLGVKNVGKLLTLNRLMELSKLDFRERITLKIDIEGEEWEILSNTDINILKQFSQIIIEFHDINLNDTKKIEVLKKMLVNHSIIFVNPNNYSKFITDHGIIYPDTLEITYLRKDLHHIDEKAVYLKETFKNDKRIPCVSNNIFIENFYKKSI